MSRDMIFPTMWYVRPVKAQTSLRIRAVWSEPFLVAWIFYEYKATDRTSFGVSILNRRLHRLVWVYTCQNAALLEVTCHGLYHTIFYSVRGFVIIGWKADRETYHRMFLFVTPTAIYYHYYFLYETCLQQYFQFIPKQLCCDEKLYHCTGRILISKYWMVYEDSRQR